MIINAPITVRDNRITSPVNLRNPSAQFSLDTNVLLGNSDTVVPSQNATKSYVDTQLNGYINISSNQTIDGVKTFTSNIEGNISGNADTADHATTSDTATSADFAADADHATTSDTATSADFAADAGYATNAGNASTVTTNANLTGHITSVGNAAVLGSFTLTQLNAAVSNADLVSIAGTETLTNKSIDAGQLTGAVSIARIASALTAPGSIGGTTPGTGAFTSLTASTSVVSGTGSSTVASIALGATSVGLASSIANQLDFITSGSTKMSINNAGSVFGINSLSATTYLAGGAGTVSAPSISWGSSTQSGFYRVGTTTTAQIGLSAGGVNVWRAHPSGGLAVGGTADPGTNSLSVGGKIGVGTSSPAQLLHVRGADARVRIDNTTGDPVLELTGTSGTSYLFTTGSHWFMRTDSFTKHTFFQSGGVQGYAKIGGVGLSSPDSQLVVQANNASASFGLLDLQAYHASTVGTSVFKVLANGNVTVGGVLTCTNAALTTPTISAPTITGVAAFTSTTRPTSSGTGITTIANDSLVTAADGDLKFGPFSAWIPFDMRDGVATTASGGTTSNTNSGGLSLGVAATVNSRAKRGVSMSAHLNEWNAGISFSRRILFSFRLFNSSLTGLQTNVVGYVQFGRTTGDTAMGPLSGTNKGFGIRINTATCTPFVYNGTTLTETLASGSTFSWKTYPRIIFDFRPGVAFDVYGTTASSSTPVLLASINSGLPSGSSSTFAGMDAFEGLLYTTAGTNAGDLAIVAMSAAAY